MAQTRSSASPTRPSLKRSLSGGFWGIYNLHYPVRHRLRTRASNSSPEDMANNCHERDNYDKHITVELLNARSSYLRWVNCATWDTAAPKGPPPAPVRVKKDDWVQFTWVVEEDIEEDRRPSRMRASCERLSPCCTVEKNSSESDDEAYERHSQQSQTGRRGVRRRLTDLFQENSPRSRKRS